MSKISMYERVQTQSDLQQLITGIVLRQTKPFTEMEIIEEVLTKIQGSPFEQKREEVVEKVGNTFKGMWVGGTIKSIKEDSPNAKEPMRWKLSLGFPPCNAKMMPFEEK